MKIVCQSCGAKYAIADDKVKGKVFKIRCKKCNEAIVVKGFDEEDDDLAGSSAPNALEEENEGATKVFDYSNYAASGSVAEQAIWHVVVEGEQRGPFTMEQLHHFQEAGTVVPETYVWREGFEEWKPLYSVPEFGAAPAPADNLFAAEPAPVGGGGLFDSPSSGRDGLFDSGRGLFDGGGDRGASPFGAVSSGLFDGGDASAGKGEVFSSTGASGAKDDLFPGLDGGGAPMDGLAPAMTGARNESSVLFSLSNLQALASSTGPTARSGGPASPAATVPSTSEASGLIDIRSLASALSDEGKKDSTGVDDFLSFGGGGFGPALGAPVLAAVRPGMSTGLKIAIGAGGIVLLAALLTLGLMLTRDKESSSSDEQIAMLLAKIQEMEKSGASEEDKAKARAELADAQSSKGGDDKAEAEPPKDASEGGEAQEDKKPEKQAKASAASGGASRKADAGGSKASPRDDGGDKARASAAAASAPSASGGGGKTKASSELDELLGGGAPAKPAAAKPAAEPKAAASSGGDMLTREQVQSGLNAVAPAVKRCAQGESGTITIQVVISPAGSVTSATPMGAYAGTPIGSCAARAVRTARFARSSKELTVKYPFKL
jgi:predicted Zn finger-like uncharacterized protein